VFRTKRLTRYDQTTEGDVAAYREALRRLRCDRCQSGLSILFTRDGDLCEVEIALSRDSSEQPREKAA
jgi:hypothetical protein